jgi:hypothetical protein
MFGSLECEALFSVPKRLVFVESNFLTQTYATDIFCIHNSICSEGVNVVLVCRSSISK